MRKIRKKTARSNNEKPLTARNADRHYLYENSVQNTESSIEIIEDVYTHHRGGPPISLREDFCGTAKLCADWVRSDPVRYSVGIDNDFETVEWAKTHNIAPLSSNEQDRVELLHSDVLEKTRGQFDVIVAFNFSYWIFQKREILKDYFKNVYESLSENSLFLFDIYGGPDSQYVMEEEGERDGFTYVWDQVSVDPINNHILCSIHYRFSDGSEMKNAFSYDWRMWSMPELRDILHEVGFRHIIPWWDCSDDVLRPKTSAENLISWVAYLAAWK